MFQILVFKDLLELDDIFYT